MKRQIVALTMVVLLLAVVGNAWGVSYHLTPGDLLVSYRQSYYGNISIRECTPAGAFVQEIPTPFSSVAAGVGIITDSLGQVAIYYQYLSSGKNYVSTLTPATGTWATTFIGKPTQNEGQRDLSLYQNYLFQRESRIDLRDSTITVFDAGFSQGTSEVSVGLDGKLYAVPAGSPASSVQMLDPLTLEKIGGTRGAFGESGQALQIQGISATKDGDIFVATNPGIVYHYDSNLHLLNYRAIDVGGTFRFNPTGLKIYDSGLIVMGDRFGRVVVTDTSLNSVNVFTVGSDFTYVALIVPEPSTLILLAAGAIGFLGWAWRRRKTA